MWTRLSGFFEKFLNIADVVIFRQIQLYKDCDNNLIVYLVPARDFVNIRNKCTDVFQQKQTSNSAIEIRISNYQSLDKLINLLKYFDDLYHCSDCTSEMENEIRSAYEAYRNNKTEYKHCIHKMKTDNSHVNPTRTTSQALITLLDREFSLDKWVGLLSLGEDPNQSLGGITLVYLLITNNLKIKNVKMNDPAKFTAEKEDVVAKALFVLICCGANFLRANISGPDAGSAFEVVLKYKSSETKFFKCYKVMHEALAYKSCQELKKTTMPKQFAIEMDIFKKNKDILTIELKPNKTIIEQRLIRIADLSEAEKKECYQLFSKYFKNPNNDEKQIQNEFDKVFSIRNDKKHSIRKNKVVNLIYHNISGLQSLVGFVVYEIINLKQKMLWHIWYLALDPNYRAGKEFYVYGIPHLAKLLYRNKKVSAYFNPMEYTVLDILGVTDKILAAPKNQSEHVISDVTEFHKHMQAYENGVVVVREGMKWCVKTDNSIVLVKNDANKQLSANPKRKLFKLFKDPDAEPIAYFYFSDHSVLQLYNYAFRAGINLNYFFKISSGFLEPFLTELTGEKCQPWKDLPLSQIFGDNIHLFFMNEDKPSKQDFKFQDPPIKACI